MSIFSINKDNIINEAFGKKSKTIKYFSVDSLNENDLKKITRAANREVAKIIKSMDIRKYIRLTQDVPEEVYSYNFKSVKNINDEDVWEPLMKELHKINNQLKSLGFFINGDAEYDSGSWWVVKVTPEILNKYAPNAINYLKRKWMGREVISGAIYENVEIIEFNNILESVEFFDDF